MYLDENVKRAKERDKERKEERKKERKMHHDVDKSSHHYRD